MDYIILLFMQVSETRIYFSCLLNLLRIENFVVATKHKDEEKK